MSKEQKESTRSQKKKVPQIPSQQAEAPETSESTAGGNPSSPSTASTPSRQAQHTQGTQSTQQSSSWGGREEEHDVKPPGVPSGHSKPDQTTSDTTSPSTPDDPKSRPRQVIAVSASKGPAAFFNLARKFLVTDEMCDLSALEGAIVSAADAAHLLERSQLATIVRVQTSYVTVEPRRRRQSQTPSQPGTPQQQAAPPGNHPYASPPPPIEQQQISPHHPQYPHPSSPPYHQHHQQHQQPLTQPKGRAKELRHARIVITVKRTESYKQWLEDNPLQAVIASDAATDVVQHHLVEPSTATSPSRDSETSPA